MANRFGLTSIGLQDKADITVVNANFEKIDNLALSEAQRGQPGGVASLDGTGKVPSAQLPATGAYFPTGGIIMWSGTVANIPDGWALCNGSNNTPDLRNKFIIGAGSTYAPGNTGGDASVSLEVANLPSHNHTFLGGYALSAGSHKHGIYANVAGTAGAGAALVSGSYETRQIESTSRSILPDVLETADAHSHNVAGSISNTGSGTAHDNMPPYYALCFIVKL